MRVHSYTKHSFPHFGLVNPASAIIAFYFILLFLRYLLTMGKRFFWCGEDAQEKWCEHCLESGYISRAHEEEGTKWGEYDCK